MTPTEVIKFQAFKLKSTVSHRVLIDAILDDPDSAEGLKKDFRNVCSLLHVTQFDQLTELCTLLNLTKREVISMALTEFLPKAQALVDDVNPFETVAAHTDVE